MLTTNECLNLEDYAFKSSPESCSSNGYFTDYTDLPSDEDFLQQLSSDLDIPLLLNPGEDEMSLLNSFFDKSPEEIMSEIALNETPEPEPPIKLHSEVKIEPEGTSSSSSSSISPVQSPKNFGFYEVKDELKDEPGSPSNHPIQPDDSKFVFSALPKIVPIQPKTYVPAQKKVVVFKNAANSSISPPPAKVVVLENVTTVPMTTVTQISPINTVVTSHSAISPGILKKNLTGRVANIDPKILKRQQRRIKNRESACLSRKKKKDYVTSLESQVKELAMENHKLKFENMELRERLTRYEGGNPVSSKSSNVKTNIVLCMFLFSMAFHLDYIKGPFLSRAQVNLIQGDKPKIIGQSGRKLLWTPDDVTDGNATSFSPFSMCPAAINQTESARLASELERWIGKPKDLVTANMTKPNPPKAVRRRKQRKYQTSFISYSSSLSQKIPLQTNKELQVFRPTPEQLYSEFFEAINRQDDTFYVVSFSDHHMLLPALQHNKTRRPKMSLIMPSMLPSENMTQPAFVALMQIDCEVLDTRLIQVRYGSIPEHLRRHDNSTFQEDSVSKSSESSTNYTDRKAYRPYFIKQKEVADRGFL